LLIVGYVITMACKSARLGPEYPITDFSQYDCVVIATVVEATHDSIGYNPLKTFKVTINKTLKGNLKIGNQISGKAKKEQARAVCPVHLDENSDYLLLLTKSVNGYRLSRFSFPVKKGYKYFDDYITQIEKSILKSNKN
jgi:hypothetical protein